MAETQINHKIGDELELYVERLSYDGGRGVARLNNFVFFVEDSAPKETVLAKVTSIKKNYGEAKLIKIIKPSASRRAPPCPVFGKCGGCNWQHITYAEQLVQKHEILKFFMRKYMPDESKIPDIMGSPGEFHYRNRVQIQGRFNQYGFYGRSSNDLVPIDTCHIAKEKLFENLLPELNKNNFTAQPKYKLELALNSTGAREIRDLSKDEGQFSQVNEKQNLYLQNYVVKLLRQKCSDFKVAYDFYCGDGNLTFPVAREFTQSQIIGVELNKSAIERANKVALSNTQFHCADSFEFLSKEKIAKNSVFILDPARAGLSKAICLKILAAGPRLIIYVSCSLSSLSRDLGYLCDSQYSVDSVKGIDMFPQTDHLETVVTLLPRAI